MRAARLRSHHDRVLPAEKQRLPDRSRTTGRVGVADCHGDRRDRPCCCPSGPHGNRTRLTNAPLGLRSLATRGSPALLGLVVPEDGPLLRFGGPGKANELATSARPLYTVLVGSLSARSAVRPTVNRTSRGDSSPTEGPARSPGVPALNATERNSTKPAGRKQPQRPKRPSRRQQRPQRPVYRYLVRRPKSWD